MLISDSVIGSNVILVLLTVFPFLEILFNTVNDLALTAGSLAVVAATAFTYPSSDWCAVRAVPYVTMILPSVPLVIDVTTF
uniref:Uncharacterized protein n=1 Tax=Podoviridae sp. ct2m58 TaxID=2827721 RepID=A0A8S5TLY2_9CAUD|nr:MAG TPA: hypothetical protein [Podoviridae sp. ct2m58]